MFSLSEHMTLPEKAEIEFIHFLALKLCNEEITCGISNFEKNLIAWINHLAHTSEEECQRFWVVWKLLTRGTLFSVCFLEYPSCIFN